MERITLPARKKKPMVKFALSSAPDSKSCTVAAILYNDDDDGNYGMASKIIVCRVGIGGGSWRTITRTFELHDIIFFEGKLHAVDANARVHVFQDGDLQRNKPCWPPKYDNEPQRLYFDDAKLHLVVLQGRLRVIGRAFGRNRVPGCTHFTSNVGVFALGGKTLEPVKDFGGHAVFVGDACCDAFPVDASSSSGSGKIRENQICFVDDEKNVSSLAAYGCRPLFRQLQSYDVQKDCIRTYEPPKPSYGTWRCVTAQRFPHKSAMELPPREADSWEERQLQDVASCLGAIRRPSYATHKSRKPGRSGVTVRISIPKSKTKSVFKYNHWSFTQRRPSAREARQAAAHEAVTFLRSRFRSVLDDSPWSSIPYYHSYVDEEEEEEEAHSDSVSDSESDSDLFDYKHWYGW
nr:uncharacterized protein LOC127295312 [Lolium perenne]